MNPLDTITAFIDNDETLSKRVYVKEDVRHILLFCQEEMSLMSIIQHYSSLFSNTKSVDESIPLTFFQKRESCFFKLFEKTRTFPRAIQILCDKISSITEKQHFFKSINFIKTTNGKKRLRRSEKRMSIQLVLLCLASRYCLLTQTCVTYTYTGRRINLDIKTIMKDTGLSRRSCQRAMSVLYGLGLVSSKQKRFTNEFGEVRGLRAKRTLTGKFFKWLGVWNLMENAKKNYKKENTPFAMPKEKKPTKEEIFNSFKKGIDVFSNPSRQTAVFTINEKHIFDSLSFTYSLKLKIPLKEGQALAKKELGYSPY